MIPTKEKIVRQSFAKIKSKTDTPDLLDIQFESFRNFFQLESTQEQRKSEGLFQVFSEIFPISDPKNIYQLEFLDYFVDPPRYTIEECVSRGLTYSVPIKVKLRLTCNDKDHTDFQTIVQEVYLGGIPYITPRGSFIINGSERVIVSQLHRSPGVFFGFSIHPNGAKIYSARVIPFKGVWMEFSTDVNNVMYAYIDRKKKFPVTALLRALGYERDRDIIELFDISEAVPATLEDLQKVKGRKLVDRIIRQWTEEFVDDQTGEVSNITRSEILVEREVPISDDVINTILQVGVKEVLIQKVGSVGDYSIIFNTLNKDSSTTELEALQLIYRKLRGTESPGDDAARGIIEKLFFSDKRYDLGLVGRHKINKKLGLSIPDTQSTLVKEDMVAIVKYLVQVSNGKAEIDDIDHLCNRRVRTVGEQIYAQFSLAISRIARTVRERMNVRDNEVFTPVDLVNTRSLVISLNNFFGTSQLSQFLDQTNPLSEITHKRRISSLGPGGLSRDRAGFEVRDVHYSHYGRLCTIETPEGPNIGLISTLCVHAKINKMGFIETPYFEVNKKHVDYKKKVYLSAAEEEEVTIGQPNVKTDTNDKILDKKVSSREQGDFIFHDAEKVQYIDVAPNQIVGLSASLIPFLEHDDANRALMGSNMQRQSVPLLRPQAPIVGTGMESKIARDSRTQIHAEGDGVVEYVDSKEIHIRYKRSEIDHIINFDDELKVYKLTKFKRTNQETCINLKPCVKKGQKVKSGDFLTEGYGVERGDLALGRNLKVAFMPWKGYNFEDAIVINERVVKEDFFTSIHVSDYELEVRDTKIGEEELTPEIPNVPEDALAHLDEDGIVRIGAHIKEGSILIGKVTPKGETDPTPEEKLLRAIFGNKAGDVKDASLRAPNGVEGVVIDKKLFQKKSTKVKTPKTKTKQVLDKLDEEHHTNLDALRKVLLDKLAKLLDGKVAKNVVNHFGEVLVNPGAKFTKQALGNIDYNMVEPLSWTTDSKTNEHILITLHNYLIKYNEELGRYKREKYCATVGDELPTGILKLAKVYIAVKRKLKVGDKMSGRHGNKGIVTKIVRQEDMPFLEDGTPVDIVLNPLGVPSRMNLGQIYESVLGWVGMELDRHFAVSIFESATEKEIEDLCKEANIPLFGHTQLYDGETGEKFDQKVTVGVIYMLKLHHMVDDKMHARSIGPYSLITQQPLGGKVQFGGQRLGEMEVWALEAYGASHLLREFLTIKSDDMYGRNKAYESIVKGLNMPNPNTPESFNVLVNELKGLAIDLKME